MMCCTGIPIGTEMCNIPPFLRSNDHIFRFIIFTVYLDIIYILVYSKIYEYEKVKTNYILERRKYKFVLIFTSKTP